ncbi:unnamed protein product, partial [marine sediment metagenome]
AITCQTQGHGVYDPAICYTTRYVLDCLGHDV